MTSFLMELLLPTNLCTISRLSFCPFSVKFAFNDDFCRRRKFRRKSNRISKPLRISFRSENDPSSNVSLNQESRSESENLFGDSNSVEVIGIGSRKDAVLDFCLDSPFQSTSLRFWNIILKDSLKVQLLQRSSGKDIAPRNVEAPLTLHSCSKAVILVGSAGYGLDHITAIELLRATKSANGLAVGIILKPFSFEGQRRQDEVRNLIDKLQEQTNFCIVVDTDALLKKEVLTLDEALKSANNAVFLAINAISILISDMHIKRLDAPRDNMKELKVQEVIRILERYKEAKVGFGAGYNIKSSITRAIFDCPFLGGGVKDINGIVICILTCSGAMDNSDTHAFLRTFRQITECTGEIILSVANEPSLEPELIVTTIIIVGCRGEQVSQKHNFLSRLALRFPFIFSLLGRDDPLSNEPLPAQSLGNPCPSEMINSSDSGEMPNKNSEDTIQKKKNSEDDTSEGLDMYSEELQTLLSRNYDEICALREYNSGDEKGDVGPSKANAELFYDPTTEGGPSFRREPLISWNVGPVFQIAQEWAKERAAVSGATPVLDNISVYILPVGVKPFVQSKDGPHFSNTEQCLEPKTLDDMNGKPPATPKIPSWDALTDAGFEAVMEFYNAASTLLKGKYADVPQKQGLLSVRAASMLESERDSQKKWSPIMDMRYRGGIYRGRCQGGLPEGKGRLSLVDGSIYDGMWRYGKRSGVGTFYFSNGDVFQGSWRDDVMHGKGWFYFHTGDRWFANFWKGKANGEGRFYSKFGDVFFGHFQDGWRHGHFLCIDVDGTRCAEIWDEGVLVSRKQLGL